MRAWRSLRVQLALVGFAAIYVPVLLLLGVTVVTETDVELDGRDGVTDVEDTSSHRSPWATWTAIAIGPAAAAVAWWWAGRAVRPIERVRAVAEDIESSADLSRRIGLDRGPSEVLSLAASFDAMLDRLADAAAVQRRLIEETSHELRTPLAVLATNADVLLAHPEPSVDAYRRALERSRSAATRLQATIDQLLVDARGRARTIDRRPVDLMVVTREIVDDVRVLAASRCVDLVLDGPASALCSLDESTVRRAIANLVDNAVGHAPGGSAVEIAVAVGASSARVVVTDHGRGIAPEAQDRIFERFWRGDAHAAGAGLGLPIAKHVAVAHGGDLTVTSPGPAGDGCSFTLALRR